jgi:hypothetical protein
VAKKKRVPAPPRAVQAPKKRVEPRDPKRTRLVFIALGVAIAVAAGAVGIAWAVGRGGGDEGVAGPCTRQEFPEQGPRHVEELPPNFEYNSTPATSGFHLGSTAVWNIYDRPVPEINVVHNLEHGGVVVQYGPDVPPAQVQQIADWYADDPNGMIVAPLAEDAPARLDDRIVLTAWRRMATCSAFDEESFSDFRDDYRGPTGNAPEEVPLENLVPGSQ